MIELPPTICEDYKEYAAIVMYHVQHANVKQLGKIYRSSPLDRDRKVLYKALDSQKNREPISPAVFSVRIYKECLEKNNHKK